jgi:tetratricopeptide (TPR) repeat protein
VKLAPKEEAVLKLLYQERPRVVEKQEFVERVWNGRTVSDDSLVRCISKLRRALPGIRIASFYGKGYCLAIDEPTVHHRLLEAARAPSHIVSMHLHARALAQRRTPQAMRRALHLLQDVIELQPQYAPARVSLAALLGSAHYWGLGRCHGVYIDDGFEQLRVVEALDPHCVGLKTCKAWMLDMAWRFDEAAPLHRQAVADAPNDAETRSFYGLHCLSVGQTDEAIAQMRHATALEPYSAVYRVALARTLLFGRHWDQAMAEAERAGREHPHNPVAQALRVGLGARLAPAPALVAQARRLCELDDPAPQALATLSYVLACCGQPDEARAVVAAATSGPHTSPSGNLFHITALLQLEDLAQALTLLRAAHEARCGLLGLVLRSPRVDALSTHAEFRRIWHEVYARLPRGAAA